MSGRMSLDITAVTSTTVSPQRTVQLAFADWASLPVSMVMVLSPSSQVKVFCVIKYDCASA
ncbi:MAG: hypothetical protein ACD_66C00107G0001 [uncultured bacterium]|nr:MAG: hypothetical protein ACD_66C00107G0001 [uncultured bacterium]